jgi:hypothetical protein
MNVAKIKENVASAQSWGALKVMGYRPSKGDPRDLTLEVLPPGGYQTVLDLSIKFLETILKNEKHEEWAELHDLVLHEDFVIPAADMLDKYKARVAGDNRSGFSYMEFPESFPQGLALPKDGSDCLYLHGMLEASALADWRTLSEQPDNPELRLTLMVPLHAYKPAVKLAEGKFESLSYEDVPPSTLITRIRRHKKDD